MIRRRRGVGREFIAGVYPELLEGTYTVWGLDGHPLGEVDHRRRPRQRVPGRGLPSAFVVRVRTPATPGDACPFRSFRNGGLADRLIG